VPDGRSGALVKNRTWPEYGVGRAGTSEHLKALAEYFDEIIKVHHNSSEVSSEKGDDVTAGIVQGQLEELEKYNWFVRAHLGS